MAWAAQRPDGSILSVGFDRAQAPADADISIIDIADDVALRVLDGKLNMQHVIGGAPPVAEVTSIVLAHTLGNSIYPSMMRQIDMDSLAALSRLIPVDAIAVEIGSRLGGSAKIILDNAPGIKRLYCIDSDWVHGSICANDPNIAWILETHGIDAQTKIYDYVQSLLGGYAAARLLPMSSPYELSWWTEPVDFIFEDSLHMNPQIRDNLEFWVKLVRSNGIIAGHDYVYTWPDVVQEVDALAARLGTELHTQGSIWWMIKP